MRPISTQYASVLYLFKNLKSRHLKYLINTFKYVQKTNEYKLSSNHKPSIYNPTRTTLFMIAGPKKCIHKFGGEQTRVKTSKT